MTNNRYKPKNRDKALAAVQARVIENPEAIAQLKILKKRHDRIENLQREIERAKNEYNADINIMGNILDVLMVRSYDLPNSTFRASERTYHTFKIVDTAAFMAWVKGNCTPDETLELFTPPTTMKDVKNFIDHKINSSEMGDFKIDGILIEDTFTMVKTEYKGSKHGSYKKENDKKENYRRYKKTEYGSNKKRR